MAHDEFLTRPRFAPHRVSNRELNVFLVRRIENRPVAYQLKRYLRIIEVSLRQREAEVIVISDDADTLSNADIPLGLPQTVPEWLSPITAIIPGQLFALHLAHVRRYDPDHPRGLRKVTETR